jgi:biotin carboxyl carrier protein
MKTVFEQGSVELIPAGKDYRVTVGQGASLAKIVHMETGRLELLIDGKPVTAYVSSEGVKRWATVNGQTFLLTKSGGGPRGGHMQHPAGELTAPMPGQIRAVSVSDGEPVRQGQTLMLLEAMKMEIRVQAPRDGVVKLVYVKQGETVEREQLLLTMEAG